MARETKIGLLVGLAFIIVIGILLSDHLTTSTEPPPAQLAQAGASIRGGIAIPGAQAVTPVVIAPPANVAPQAPVPTPGDLAPKPPVQQIAVGPAPQQGQPAPTTGSQTAVAAQNAIESPASTSDLAAVAHSQGEEIVPVSPQAPVPTKAAVPEGRATYVAVAGDTLSRMAGRLPGGNTKANRAALIAANPELKANPNLIVAGKTYVLPGGSGAASAVSTAGTAGQSSHAAQSASSPQRWYTVKAGDNLWKIAKEEVGSPSAIAAIRHLNKDVLDGKDIVRVGMKLRLPAHNEVAATD